eukprot:20618-Heterococcus_DN1.PRE.2
MTYLNMYCQRYACAVLYSCSIAHCYCNWLASSMGQFKQSIAFSRVCTGQAFCKPFTGLPKAWIYYTAVCNVLCLSDAIQGARTAKTTTVAAGMIAQGITLVECALLNSIKKCAAFTLPNTVFCDGQSYR